MENENCARDVGLHQRRIEDLAFQGAFRQLFCSCYSQHFAWCASRWKQHSSFQHPEPDEGRRGLVGGPTHKRSSVKQNFPARIELLQEIKIKNIACQHGAAMLSSCGK